MLFWQILVNALEISLENYLPQTGALTAYPLFAPAFRLPPQNLCRVLPDIILHMPCAPDYKMLKLISFFNVTFDGTIIVIIQNCSTIEETGKFFDITINRYVIFRAGRIDKIFIYVSRNVLP